MSVARPEPGELEEWAAQWIARDEARGLPPGPFQEAPRGHYVSPDGYPLTFAEATWWLAEPGRRRVAITQLGAVGVSTIYLPIGGSGIWLWWMQHPEAERGPAHYETCVFENDGSRSEVVEVYGTEAEAVAGHDRWVAFARLRAPDDAQALARGPEDEPNAQR